MRGVSADRLHRRSCRKRWSRFMTEARLEECLLDERGCESVRKAASSGTEVTYI